MSNIKELWNEAKEVLGEQKLVQYYTRWITGIIKKERARGQNVTLSELFLHDAQSILEDLNKRTGSRFRSSEANLKYIKSRYDDGYTVDDFKRVHEEKCRQWLNDPDWEKYLRPETLYRPSHFESYLNEWYRYMAKQKEAEKKKTEAKQASPETKTETKNAEAQALIMKLNGKKWNEFDTWYDFMMWTVQFPDEKSLGAYPMPDRIRAMRCEPGMLRKVATKRGLDEAENVYKLLKEKQK